MIGGRLNGNTVAARTCCAAPNMRPISACTLSRRGRAVGERLQLDEHERGVALLRAVQQGEADDGEGVLHAGQLLGDALHLPHHVAGARDGGAVRQLDGDEEPALVLVRQEPGRRAQRQPGRCRRRTPAPAPPRSPTAAASCPRDRRSRRARRRCRADPRPMMPRLGPLWRRNTAHSAGDSVSAFSAEISTDTLMVTANWRNNWPEIPGMNAIGTNTDSSTSVMAMIGAVICAIASLVASGGRHLRVLLHHPFDVLDHDDGVIHHDADRQHQRQQRHGVGRVSQRQQPGERADQADRHRDGRDQRRAQAAEEQEHHDDHQHERLAQRLQHLAGSCR